MNQEHHEKDIRTNNVGASQDFDKELSGAENKGTYFDSENGRPSSNRGNKGAWEKIRGEETIHSNSGPGSWFNMVSESINDDTFELWVEITGAHAPKIVINGLVMGQSEAMPWLYQHRIQNDVNNNCIGGEIFLTDFNSTPMILNIKDIKDNYDLGTQKYFDQFNPNLYYINLQSPLDVPMFKGLINLGGGGGLPVGSYQYSLRFSNDQGDKTNWGTQTPTIPVLQSVDTTTSDIQYHGIKSYGAAPNISSPTSFGVKLKFRVTNLNDYQYIELRRVSYNLGAGIDNVPQGQIIARIPVSPGEISIIEFTDPVDSNIPDETLADNEDSYELSVITKAKGIRYYDKKLVLMNYEIASKETNAEITDINGSKIIPVTKNLGSIGFNNPVNHAYFKNYPSGEKFSFGINMFDGAGGSGFVFEDDDLKNVQVPNRRDEVPFDSQALSIGAIPIAANVDSDVTSVFEIFSHENAIGKPNGVGPDDANVRNISTNGTKDGIDTSDIGYKPLRPVNSADTKVDHSYRPNIKVRDSGNDDTDYDPQGFRLDYHTKGFAIGGVANMPSWTKSFSVVRSERANRVICQGIGMYSMREGDISGIGSEALVEKDNDKMWFHSPDIESGIVNASILADMQENPGNYQIQLVSPLGFFSEVYNFNNKALLPNRDRIVDMMSYARIQWDNGQINPNEDSNMGIGSGGRRYVGYNKYRNISDTAGGDAFAGNDGNKIFTMDGFSPITDGRSTFYQVGFTEQVYNRETVGAGTFADNDFDDEKMKDWTEPFYIINIIQVGKVVKDFNINNYRSTGHYQKIESIIGEGDSTNDQSFELVDERWEDVAPALNFGEYNYNGESFVYLRDVLGIERCFFNVSFLTGAEILAIQTAITDDGFYVTPIRNIQIVGIYTHTVDNGDVTLNFNYPDYIPISGERVIVKYDITRPIVFFGGDTVVNENIFAPIDKEADATASDNDGQFVMNIGFPYRRYDMNNNIFIVEDVFLNNIQASDRCRLGYLRQLCMMYAAESRTATNFAFNAGFPLAYFPLTHYIMRPNEFNDSNFGGGVIADIADDNDIYEEYFTDFPQEYTLWKFGGIRFKPQINFDYSVKGPVTSFSKPDVGFTEETKFCTGVKWSLSRATNQQNSPGLKTFLSGNVYIADDDCGDIVKAWDARTDSKGSNLYGIAEKGIVMFLTKKSILSNLDGETLSTTSFDSFISREYWISKQIGSNDEMWRGMAESSVEVITESGRVEVAALYIPNNHSIYRLMENSLMDIAKDRYLSRMKSSLENISEGYDTHIIGHYNKNNNEYWLQMPDGEDEGIQKVFVYGQDNGYWVGRFTYSYDSYLFKDNKNFGFKNSSMMELDKGFLIDGEAIQAYLIQNTSVNIVEEKEFISIEVNTGPRGEMKPTSIVFMDEEMNILCELNASLFGQNYLKQYSGWWNQIPRKRVEISPKRERVQYRLILFKIIHTFEEDFKIVSSVIQYKTLK